ncbi:MAG: hypothetical protein ACT4PM_11065 [Gemmatimonadales bacterium]
MRCYATSAAVAGLAAATLHAQVAERPLPKPNAELAESFSAVSSIRELPDGRVLVVDGRDRAVFLANFASNAVTKVGREGAGPLEYRAPGLLIPRGDSTWLLDLMLRRFLILDRAGVPVRTQTLSVDPTAAFRVTGLRGVDSQGRRVSEVQRMEMGPGTIQVGGMAFVVRWSDSARVDTVARLVAPAIEPRISGTPSAGMRIGVPIVPPTDRDLWDLLPDGTVAIARAADYHIEYVRPNGSRVSGPLVPHTRIALTEADRDRIRRETRARMEESLKAATAAAGGQGVSLAIDLAEPKAWPRHFPPFERVRGSGDGRLWIAPPSRGSEDAVRWDVIAAGGTLALRVRFPPRTTLVGFGKSALYTVRTDEDDLQYLQRHPLP